MENSEKYLSEIKEIRKMMEESSRFLSLSGLSGILVGIYAMFGAALTYYLVYSGNVDSNFFYNPVAPKVALIAFIVLVLSLATVIILTIRRVRKAGKKFWNPGTRLMLINLALPLVSGGIFIMVLTSDGIYGIVAAACLIFYGLALTTAAKFTRQEIFYLGIFQIVLGIIAALLPSLGLLFWALGFGVLHIIYGILMYYRYEYNKAPKS
ncbi:hypothetical protein [Maribellus mangrovi]|uniref:hypothetical protein n=1 Tax=Maribellus mangrovi TaxID=3133146 RepID=UPI0030EB440E